MDIDFMASTQASLLLAVSGPGTPNEHAWAAFKGRYESQILSWCRRQGLDPWEAEEVSQQILVKLLGRLPTFVYDGNRKFRGWLHKFVADEVAAYWRARHRRPADFGGGGTDHQRILESLPDPDEAGADVALQGLEEQIEQEARIYAACERVRNQVEERTWQAFLLTTIEGLKGKDVAGRLEMSVEAVHMAKSRVLRRIREELGLDQQAKVPGDS